LKLLNGIILGLLLGPSLAWAQATPVLPGADRVRLAEAIRLSDALGSRVWAGWQKSPIPVLLVTPETEFLTGHPRPGPEFASLGPDSLLGQEVGYRKRVFSTNFLATFPAVGGVPTIVVGQAENTEAQTSSRWVVSLLHEHFHQLQDGQPGYFAGVNALGLARGDTTGMWMLNYPFPYGSPPVSHQFSRMCGALREALQNRGYPSFRMKYTAFVKARARLLAQVGPEDRKYFEFQEWQEGIARYTEYRIAELAAAEFEPSPSYRALADYTPFKMVAKSLMDIVQDDLATIQLGEARRVAFYSLGVAEGLVLDEANPTWKEKYFRPMFSLGSSFRQVPQQRRAK